MENSNVNFTHIRLYGDDGFPQVNSGETLAHKTVGGSFLIARARVNENDRYVKSIGRAVAIQRLDELEASRKETPGKAVMIEIDEIARAIADQYVSGASQAMISGPLKDIIRNTVYKEILADPHQARENLYVTYAISRYGEKLFLGIPKTTFFPMGRKIGMSYS